MVTDSVLQDPHHPFYYRPQRSCGKVMSSQASVILFTRGCGRHPPDTTWADTPLCRYPQAEDTPQLEDTPLVRPLWAEPPPPADGYCSGRYASMHPTGIHSCLKIELRWGSILLRNFILGYNWFRLIHRPPPPPAAQAKRTNLTQNCLLCITEVFSTKDKLISNNPLLNLQSSLFMTIQILSNILDAPLLDPIFFGTVFCKFGQMIGWCPVADPGVVEGATAPLQPCTNKS